ncbi:MAG: hypothetical protein GXX96_03195 [Planctomycetaceae bacterium]|nr:hypothetical protein [Planctomycetaceae bacterium]
MSQFRNKAIVTLLTGGYLLAVTVSGAFHTHSGPGCCSEPSGVAIDCRGHVCHVGHAHQVRTGSPQASDALGVSAVVAYFDSHCPICSFMSQKPIPASMLVHQVSAELRQPLVHVRAVPPSDDVPSTVFGRGPPIA